MKTVIKNFMVAYHELRKKHPEKFNGAHEAWAVLYEEVDELWDEVKKKSKFRSKKLMAAEAMQVATVALRFIEDLCQE